MSSPPTSPPIEQKRLQSPWSTREKIGRMLWSIVQASIFRLSFHNWYGLRNALLRMFGAKLGRDVRFRRTAKIEIPWNLDFADGVTIGDHVILYSLGMIRIGARSFVSQYGHLCAGTHDATRSDYPLVLAPISIGEDVWIAADAFVGPGITIGDRAILGARASAFSDLPPDMICVGNPAKPIKPREFRRVLG
jgi:putative colanic acid biosynthesis acetyltransferase WcaF